MAEGDKHDHHGQDFIVLGPPTQGGGQMAIRHREDHVVEVCELRKAEDGKPLPENAELIKLSGEGPTYKVESIYDGRKGPSKVATKVYRDNFDTIFGKKSVSNLDMN